MKGCSDTLANYNPNILKCKLCYILYIGIRVEEYIASGKLEVKCPSKESAVTPLDACADPKFFWERVGDQCCLKTNHEYYAQVQGQMVITGAAWCDFAVYTLKGMSIQRIKFNQQFWDNVSDKLKDYNFQHFLSFAVSEYKCKQNEARL